MTSEIDDKYVVLKPELTGTKVSAEWSSAWSYVISPMVLILGWELLAGMQWIDTRFFPPPSSVAQTFWRLIQNGDWFVHVGATLSRVLIGFIIGSAIGILFGLLMGLIPAVRLILYPLIAAIYPIPKVAIFPLILLVLGMGEASKLTTVAATCFFLLSISAMTGVSTIPRVYMEAGRNYGRNNWTFIWTVALPASLPVIFSGLKLAMGSAFLVVVSVEFVSSDAGIGWLIWNSWELFSIRQMFVGLLTVSALGLILMFSLEWLEKILIPWRL